MNDLEYFIAILKISQGIFTTLKYAFCSAILGLIVGFFIFICKASKNKLTSYFANFYLSIFRGTPLILQLTIVYFGIPQLLKINLSTFSSIVIAFGLNSGAYIAEIFRSGFNSISIGQLEACKVLNIDKKNQYKHILLPQIFRNILPTLVNEISSLTKETAIISIIGELDIMRYANLVAVEYYTYFTPMIFAGFCYFFIIKIITFIGYKIEKKLSYD